MRRLESLQLFSKALSCKASANNNLLEEPQKANNPFHLYSQKAAATHNEHNNRR